jgi:hypothetical protein
VSVSRDPKCFITAHKESSKTRPWIANICYSVEVRDLDFRPSDECIEIGFFDHESIKNINTIANVIEVFTAVFSSK